jgi:hypothetical protein
MSQRPNPRDEDAAARRARYVFYGIGGIFVALGFALETVPTLAATTPWWSGRAGALIGVVFLSVGRYASDRFVRRCESLLAGWF